MFVFIFDLKLIDRFEGIESLRQRLNSFKEAVIIIFNKPSFKELLASFS